MHQAKSPLDIKLIAQAKQELTSVGIPPVDLLAKYMAAMMVINEKINLTGAKDMHTFALKHIADSYRAWGVLGGLKTSIYDVGSGGGLPGIVLAILSPHTKVTLVERRKKKASATKEILELMGMQNRVDVIDEGFETLADRLDPDSEFWFRGFMPGDELIKFLSDNFDDDRLGNLILMKGPSWEEEKHRLLSIKKARSGWVERFMASEVIDYELPENAGKRKLVLV